MSVVGCYRRVHYKRQRVCEMMMLPQRAFYYFTYVDGKPTGDHFRTIAEMECSVDRGEIIVLGKGIQS